MRRASKFSITFVTAPNVTVARRIARELLTDRLIACANLVPGIESHYWWEGRCQKGREILMILKSPTSGLNALESRVLQLHPYDTAEIVSIQLDQGTERYLDWITASTHAGTKTKLRVKQRRRA